MLLSKHIPLEVKIKLFELITLFDYLAVIIKYMILTGIFQIYILNGEHYKIRNRLVEKLLRFFMQAGSLVISLTGNSRAIFQRQPRD